MDARYITYEQFGAKGDGVTDDMEAIVKAHEAANAEGLPVKAREGATYYVGGRNLTARVMTDLDFTGAKMIIDDRRLENIRSSVFSVVSAYEPFDPGITSIEAGQEKLDFPHEGSVFLRVYNDDKAIYIRKGINANKGVAQSDVILVDGEGNVLTTVDWSYEKITRQYCKRVDDEPITIKGGTFVTIANQWEREYKYHSRNISVTRSNVTVEGITHLIEGEGEDGAPYSGFISASECVGLTVRNCLLTPHKTYQTKDSYPGHVNCMGTYDVNLNATIGTKLLGLKQTRDILDTRYWGLMGSNFCKDILLEDCDISRFDAHMGVSRGVIRRCRLGHQCLNLIGFGEFLIEDSFALGASFIGLRSDYGSFFRGKVTIRNCVWRPKSLDHTSTVFSARNTGDHDFGYRCYMPTEIIIDGLTVEDGEVYDGVELYILPDYADAPTDQMPFPNIPTGKLTYSGIVSKKGREVKVCRNAEFYPNLEVTEA